MYWPNQELCHIKIYSAIKHGTYSQPSCERVCLADIIALVALGEDLSRREEAVTLYMILTTMLILNMIVFLIDNYDAQYYLYNSTEYRNYVKLRFRT